MVLKFYREVRELLELKGRAVLLVVTEHCGSSPGKQGFHMYVDDEHMAGTIGGGIMEHKLVELARDLLKKGHFTPFVKTQLHDPDAGQNRSGMICKGRQTIAFYCLEKGDLDWIRDSGGGMRKKQLMYSNEGISIEALSVDEMKYTESGKNRWAFTMPADQVSRVFVIGAGHVGFSLCRVLSLLDFEVHLLDNRKDLNTFHANDFADSKKIISYENVDEHIPEGGQNYVVIISFGYRTDKIILKRLLGKKFRYIGMMGSSNKVKVLWSELLAEGFSEGDLNQVVSPIGLEINGRTTDEIAISIAAQLIQWKNSLPQKGGDI